MVYHGMRTNRTVCLLGFNTDFYELDFTLQVKLSVSVSKIIDLEYLNSIVHSFHEKEGKSRGFHRVRVCGLSLVPEVLHGTTVVGELQEPINFIYKTMKIEDMTTKRIDAPWNETFSSPLIADVDSITVENGWTIFEYFFKETDKDPAGDLRKRIMIFWIQFKHCYQDAVDRYITRNYPELNGGNFSALHLRLEDDWLNYKLDHKTPIQALHYLYAATYSLKSLPLKTKNIFICTGILNPRQKRCPHLYFAVDYLKQYFKVYALPKREILRDYCECDLPKSHPGPMAGIFAIFDFIIATRAQSFIGEKNLGSSFDQAVIIYRSERWKGEVPALQYAGFLADVKESRFGRSNAFQNMLEVANSARLAVNGHNCSLPSDLYSPFADTSHDNNSPLF